MGFREILPLLRIDMIYVEDGSDEGRWICSVRLEGEEEPAFSAEADQGEGPDAALRAALDQAERIWKGED